MVGTCWRASWRKGGTRDGDDVISSAVKLLACHVDVDGGTRTDTTKRVAAAAKAWSTIKSRHVRVMLDLSVTGRILEAVVLSKTTTKLWRQLCGVRRASRAWNSVGSTRMTTFRNGVASKRLTSTFSNALLSTWDTVDGTRVIMSSRRWSPRELRISAGKTAPLLPPLALPPADERN